ncbi:MAG: site-specific DNA-methyltransferase [Crocosphaera sp.]|nr:site-specific DNA-methyltransferase [Crocosphaera sp.]
MNSSFLDLPLNQIFLGDCLKLLKQLPDECVDLIVSSPPYNIGKEYEAKKALEKYLEEQTIILQECSRILKKTGSLFWQVGAFSNQGSLIPLDIRFFPILESCGLIPRNRIIWIRQHGLHARNKFSCRHETILWFTKSNEYIFNLDSIRVPQKYQNKKHYKGQKKGELSCNPKGKNPGDIWLFRNVKHNHEEQTIHPCQFPEDLISRIILATTQTNDIVFDPYMGSGTVAVVSRNHQRNFMGSEIEEKYYHIAVRRLEEKPNQTNHFPNLKSLRNYVEKTGENIEKYRFDMQTGKKATERKKAKIFPEEYHRQELEHRLLYEESAFSADLRNEDRPIDVNLNGGRSKKKVKIDQSSDKNFKQLEIEL